MNSSNNEIVDEVNEIIDEFGFFDDWEDKYAYLIDMGKKLEPMDEELKVEETKLRGCQSTVYFYSEKSNEGLVNFKAFSDAAIVLTQSHTKSSWEPPKFDRPPNPPAPPALSGHVGGRQGCSRPPGASRGRRGAGVRLKSHCTVLRCKCVVGVVAL